MNPKLCEIGNRIKEHRLKQGLTMLELAHRIGFKSDSAISYLEKGMRQATHQNYQKIANELKVPISVLLGFESITSASMDMVLAKLCDV